MKKRLVGMICALAMCLTLLPVAALAAEEKLSYVALGDSISSGYGLEGNEKSFVELVAEANSFELTDLAEEGETTTSLLAKAGDEKVVAAVTGADVITLTIGGNDLMNALYTYLANAYNAANQGEEEASVAITAEQVAEKLMKGDQEMLTFALDKISGFAASTEAAGALKTFTDNLTAIVTAIKSVNADVTLVMVNQYNPYQYLAGSVASFMPDMQTIADAFEVGVSSLNGVIAAGAEKGGYVVADAYTAVKGAEKNPCNASLSLPMTVNLDFHPNAYGHELIAGAVKTALPAPEEPGYEIKVEAENGTVTVDPQRAEAEETVTITVTPNTGYELDTITVTDGDGKAVEVTKDHTFVMPDSAVTVKVTFVKSESAFTDVAEDSWYYEAVMYVTENNLMNGTGEGKFSPAMNLNRAMLMTILARMDGEDTTGGDTWYSKGLEWAVENGISDGTNPDADISREQMVTMLYRYMDEPDVTGDLSAFTDGDSTSDWAEDAVIWAVQKGLLQGNDNKLNPTGTATRMEVATILMRFCENVLDQ